MSYDLTKYQRSNQNTLLEPRYADRPEGDRVASRAYVIRRRAGHLPGRIGLWARTSSWPSYALGRLQLRRFHPRLERTRDRTTSFDSRPRPPPPPTPHPPPPLSDTFCSAWRADTKLRQEKRLTRDNPELGRRGAGQPGTTAASCVSAAEVKPGDNPGRKDHAI
jgi:hypothetical protein